MCVCVCLSSYVQGRLLGIKDTFTPTVASVAVSLSSACDPAVSANAQRIYDVLTQEEAMFSATLDRGNKQLEEMMQVCTDTHTHTHTRIDTHIGMGRGCGAALYPTEGERESLCVCV